MKERQPNIRTRLETSLKAGASTTLALVLAYAGDAHGYSDESSIKLFSGEVIPPLAGSGHSMSAVALIWLALDSAGAFLEQPFSNRAKAVFSAALPVAFELIALNNQPDNKDSIVAIGTAVFLYCINELALKRSKQSQT